ncbi:MAG: MFS transporter [Halobacteriaceae archaeon]
MARLREYDALALTSGIWFLAKFLRYAFPPLFPTLREVYHVSNAAVGALFTGLMLAYALMQFPSGALADRVGTVRVIAAGALVAAGAAFLLTVPLPLPALVAAMVLVGVGTGAHKTVAVRLVSTVYPARTGRSLGAMDTLGALGGVAAPAAVVAATGTVGWRTVFLGAGVAGALAAALFVRRVPRRLPDDRGRAAGDGDGERGGARDYVDLFAAARFRRFVVVTVLFSFAYNGLVAFLPLYLTSVGGLSEAAAGLAYSGLFVVSLVQPLTGEAGDRVGPLPVIVGALALATAGLVGLLALASGGLLALGATVLALGLGSHGFRPVRGAYLVAVIPDDVAGGGLGVVRTVLMGAGAVAPAVVGALSDAAGFAVAFALLAGTMGLAAAVAASLLPGDTVR